MDSCYFDSAMDADSQFQMTPAWVSDAVGVPLPSSAKHNKSQPPFTHVTTDSRKVQPGCLFVALKGDQFDGHDFVAQAVEQGARGILCQKGTPVPESNQALHTHFYFVDDTLTAFRNLGASWRKKFSIPVIAVAGSVGKTTTKEFLHSLLQGKWQNVLKTQGSQNGFVGIPLTLLELRKEHDAAVIEVGIDEIGAMDQHIPLVAPTGAILTTIGPEHLEKLHDVPTVAHEEGLALLQTAKLGGIIAVNLDDPWIRPFSVTLHEGKRFSFSMKPDAQASETLLTGKMDQAGRELELNGMGLRSLRLPLPLLGAHNAQNLLGAACIARSLGLTEAELRAGIKQFKGADGRSELKELPGPSPIVCDYYNANPASVEAGLELLNQVAKPRHCKRWACLADMLELGKEEERFHRALAKKILTLGIEHVYLLGKRMEWLSDELKTQGFTGDLKHFLSHTDLAASLTQSAQAGDAILIKGSRSMKMEEIWKALEPFARKKWKNRHA